MTVTASLPGRVLLALSELAADSKGSESLETVLVDPDAMARLDAESADYVPSDNAASEGDDVEEEEKWE